MFLKAQLRSSMVSVVNYILLWNLGLIYVSAELSQSVPERSKNILLGLLNWFLTM